ncbi:GNAT family N-acetyltransferase [Deinococcus koreensis]|uniref:GNAT family N-acetyltransferase n=1 Tax=Deinococcus koreensis TaxID=2054903 RepID=A0A2K3UX29_9DEIO|nr:GNAT family N-acetyltransferase [Deinococcus koreensis]PNY81088.1 GNAT family N-acetyltransferase [Deinococcus koreensis]
MNPTLRPYRPADRAACLALFDSNVPEFFALHERASFETDLEQATEYFVVEDSEGVVACGGVWVGGDGHADRPGGFVWGMVRRALHGHGYGSLLVQARLERLRELGVREVRLDTSPKTAPFYARFGFREVGRVADGYGPGLDRVDMALTL